MGTNRVFLPQEALEHFLEEGSLDGDFLTVEGQRFRVETALRFMAEVADGGDADGLVGKIKTVGQVQAMDGEHSADSVIIGDNAYEVIEGFLAEPMVGEIQAPADGSDPFTRIFVKD